MFEKDPKSLNILATFSRKFGADNFEKIAQTGHSG